MVINEPKIKKEVICSVFDSIEKGRIDLSLWIMNLKRCAMVLAK